MKFGNDWRYEHLFRLRTHGVYFFLSRAQEQTGQSQIKLNCSVITCVFSTLLCVYIFILFSSRRP